MVMVLKIRQIFSNFYTLMYIVLAHSIRGARGGLPPPLYLSTANFLKFTMPYKKLNYHGVCPPTPFLSKKNWYENREIRSEIEVINILHYPPPPPSPFPRLGFFRFWKNQNPPPPSILSRYFLDESGPSTFKNDATCL